MKTYSEFVLENPMDRGGWWAAVYGVAQSRTRLKRLSSSSGEFVCIIAIFSYALNYLSFFGLGWSHGSRLPSFGVSKIQKLMIFRLNLLLRVEIIFT